MYDNYARTNVMQWHKEETDRRGTRDFLLQHIKIAAFCLMLYLLLGNFLYRLIIKM